MDLVDWSEARLLEIEAEFRVLADHLGIETVTVIPVAAVSGENIVDRAHNMSWYHGPTLLEFLESVEVADPARHAALRFPVQYVLRPQSDEFHDYRGYAGTIAAGEATPGMEVTVLPLGVNTTLLAVDAFETELPCAGSGEAVTLRLADDIDISRGHMIVDAAHPPAIASRITADLCWMSDTSQLKRRQQFFLKHTTRRVRCRVESIDDRLEVESFDRIEGPESLALNDIGRVTLRMLR